MYANSRYIMQRKENRSPLKILDIFAQLLKAYKQTDGYVIHMFNVK